MKTLPELIRGLRILDLGPLPAPRLGPSATVQQALQMMVRARRGAVVVVEEARPVGIFTERDVVTGPIDDVLASRERRSRMLLRDVMSTPPRTVRRQATLADAMQAMVEHGYRHLVVVDHRGELRGLLNCGDVVQFLTDQFPEETVNLPPRLRQHYDRPEGA